jgi:hypothetical protein
MKKFVVTCCYEINAEFSNEQDIENFVASSRGLGIRLTKDESFYVVQVEEITGAFSESQRSNDPS